jgi:ATP-dependent Lon protease
VLAAHRAGIRKIIIPKENERDLEDVPIDVRGELAFVLVTTVEEVLKEALSIDLPAPALSCSGKVRVPAHNL